MLDARSKSERGDALAQLAHDLAAAPGEADDAARATRDQQAVAGFWAPRNAGAVKLDESMTPMQAMAAVAAECVDHIARNAAVLAEVNTLGVYRAGTPEHVHQLRVGVRRLRSAWRLFDGWIADPSETLAQGARTHFSAFGMARDQDVLADTIMPLLARAGMPALPAEAAPSNDNAQSLAADRAFQGWLLELLAWSLDVPPPPAPAATAEAAAASPTIIPLAPPAEAAPPALRKRLTGRLRRWHLKVIDEGLRFGALELEARHELRNGSSACATVCCSPNPCCRQPGCAPIASNWPACRTCWARSTIWRWRAITTRRRCRRTRRPGSRWAGSAPGSTA